MLNDSNRPPRGVKSSPSKDEEPSVPRENGWVKVPHAATAVPGMSDMAFRAWIAIQRWEWDGSFPSNSQLAAACGWVSEAGVPSASKAKRALRQLEALGKVERHTRGSAHGLVRVGLDIKRPKDVPRKRASKGGVWRVKNEPGGRSELTQGGGSNLTHSEEPSLKTHESSSSTTGADADSLARMEEGIRACQEAGRQCYPGNAEEVAAMVRANARDTHDTLGGRWDLYAQALRDASGRKVRNLHGYALAIARKALQCGPQAPPVSVGPSRPKDPPLPPRMTLEEQEEARKWAARQQGYKSRTPPERTPPEPKRFVSTPEGRARIEKAYAKAAADAEAKERKAKVLADLAEDSARRQREPKPE